MLRALGPADRTTGAVRRSALARVAPGLAALLAFCAIPCVTPADAGPVNLVTDGTFQNYTSITGYGGYICNSGTASSCVSNLTYWKSNCSSASGTTRCNTSDTPSSLLLNPGNGGTAWNGGNGFWAYSNPTLGNVVAIDGDSNYSTTLSQTITGLTVGDKYSLTFMQAAAQQNGLSGATTEQWRVTFGSQTLTSTLMNNASHGFVAWNQQTLVFVATAASQTLSFLSVGTPAGEPPVTLLNNVALVDIPEPRDLAVLAGGFAMLLAARLRKRKPGGQAG